MAEETRFEKARRLAAATSDERRLMRAAADADRSVEIASMGHSAAGAEASRITSDPAIGYLGPIATPHEWGQALVAAREVVVEAARRRETLTYGEMQVAAYRGSGRKIGHSMYGTFCMELNDPGRDGCLISSIIVTTDTGGPGPGLLPYAQSVGFQEPIVALQRDVFEHFGDH